MTATTKPPTAEMVERVREAIQQACAGADPRDDAAFRAAAIDAFAALSEPTKEMYRAALPTKSNWARRVWLAMLDAAVRPVPTKWEKLDAKRAREIWSYDPETGLLRWKIRRPGGCAVGNIAGTIMPRGDVIVRYYHTYPATHLIWLIVTGSWPNGVVDHRDHDPSNNKWNNLRDATRPQNGYNRKRYKTNTSGYKGVFRDGRNTKKWRACISKDGKKISLGYYHTQEEAYSAYIEAAKRLHGDFHHV